MLLAALLGATGLFIVFDAGAVVAIYRYIWRARRSIAYFAKVGAAIGYVLILLLIAAAMKSS